MDVLVICVCLCHTAMSVSCSLVVIFWGRADLLAFLYVMFSCVYVTFPYGVLGQVWNLIVSITDLCLLPYFHCIALLYSTLPIFSLVLAYSILHYHVLIAVLLFFLPYTLPHIILNSTRENLTSGVCKQQRHKPACASAQSDQRLCYSLIEKYNT